MEKKKIALLVSVITFLVFLATQEVIAANIPPLKEGTFLTGQTLSVWPSWSVLGGALGQALPVDPINQLAAAGTCASTTNRFCTTDGNCPTLNNATTTREKCILHDPVTGWSVADRRFSFACNKDSYAYRYIVDSSTNSYIIRAHFEDAGLSAVNFNDFVNDFVSTSFVKIDQGGGVCNFNEEISTIESGRCGDGKLNLQRGEQCDPPGRIEYQANCANNQLRNLTVCNNSCQWVASTTPCNSLSRCGNGRKEAGEACDDGALNGRYNRCNTTCSGRSSEFCGNEIVSSTYEICDPGTPGIERYGLAGKNQSCSWDCQNWGPYCGDNIVQAEHGEECDGSQTCSVDGGQGTKICTNVCKKDDDKDLISWWSFSSLEEDTVNPGEKVVNDRSVNVNNAFCRERSCPSLVNGKIGQALSFNSRESDGHFLRVKAAQSLRATDAMSIEVWINPSSDESLYQRIVERGGAENYTGYDLEFNASSTRRIARFNLWKGSPVGVDSTSEIPLNVWTHIVASYEKIGNAYALKMYINGVLEREVNDVNMEESAGDLFIGQSGARGGSEFFFGSLDEIKIYSRALSAGEVRNNFQTGWRCVVGAVVPTPPAVENIPASCGNGVVDANEACDRGAANNGRACTASYGQSCSYCAANCQNVVDVQPREYCGNGIIEQRERCDTLSPGGIIFSVATSTDNYTSPTKDEAHNGFQELACSAEPYSAHTISKGTKTCGDCMAGVIRNCVRCGVDQNGVSITGGVINVLATSTGPQDTLFTKDIGRLFENINNSEISRKASSSLKLAIGLCGNSMNQLLVGQNMCDNPEPSSPMVAQLRKGKNDQDLQLSSYTLLNPYGAGNALINSNPVCSQGEQSQKYSLYINDDWTRPISFPVVASPQSWQYDVVLSPVIDSTVRNKDVRVVVSWVSGEFYGGILNPFTTTTPEISGPSYCNSSTNCAAAQKKYATGVRYYNTPDSQLFGVWYHGLNSTQGRTEAESFTINTANMSGNTYSFFVRSPSAPIRQFKNTARLKVEVFLPEAPYNPDQSLLLTEENRFARFPFRFGLPVKTYYFNAAMPSDNPNARYWHVFNINKPEIGMSVSSTDILDVHTIFTGPVQFKYSQPLIRDDNPIQDPNSNIGDGEGGDPFVPQPEIDPGQGGGPQGGPVAPLPFDPQPDQFQ